MIFIENQRSVKAHGSQRSLYQKIMICANVEMKTLGLLWNLQGWCVLVWGKLGDQIRNASAVKDSEWENRENWLWDKLVMVCAD